jgi:hypothetical protein
MLTDANKKNLAPKNFETHEIFELELGSIEL